MVNLTPQDAQQSEQATMERAEEQSLGPRSKPQARQGEILIRVSIQDSNASTPLPPQPEVGRFRLSPLLSSLVPSIQHGEECSVSSDNEFSRSPEFSPHSFFPLPTTTTTPPASWTVTMFTEPKMEFS